MHNYSKTFFSQNRARNFAENLESQHCEDIEIWSGQDAFGQTNYIVKWNYWGKGE